MDAIRLRGRLRAIRDKIWVEFVADFGHAKKFFPDADVFPSVLVVRKPVIGHAPSETEVCAMPREDVPDKHLSEAVANPAYNFSLPRLHFTRESWALDRPEAVALLKKIRDCGTPLKTLIGAEPLYGIKTGFNEAFVIDAQTRQDLISEHSESGSLIRPYLRGQDISRWSCPDTGLYMIVMKSSGDHPWPWADAPDQDTAERRFRDAFPSLHRHFKKFEEVKDTKSGAIKGLRHREDQGRYWWELRPCAYYTAFEAPKTLYVDIAWKPSFLVDTRNRFVNNTCYFLPTASPAVAASLNSPIGWWYSWRKAQHGKDEALRYFTSFMETYPIAPLTHSAQGSVAASVEQLSNLVEQYQLADRSVTDWLHVEFQMKKLKAALTSPSGLDPDAFVTAVREALPKKRKLSAAEIAELRREHATTLEPARQVRAKIFALERKLSDLVNAAYGLTAEEVDLMWRTAPPRMPFTPTGLQSNHNDDIAEDTDTEA